MKESKTAVRIVILPFLENTIKVGSYFQFSMPYCMILALKNV
jgi:hypothetical protein